MSCAVPPSQNDCVEDECVDSDQCGNETSGPRQDQLWCAIDSRPLLPLALAGSTMAGMAVELMVQVPLEAKLYGLWSEATWYYITIPLYAITLLCLIWSGCADPGQLPKDYSKWLQDIDASLLAVESVDPEESDRSDNEATGDKLLVPKRAHKCWQFPRPVRRYDHYCRWLCNVIGLYNHRQFLIMCSGLVLIGVTGVVRDVALEVVMYRSGEIEYAHMAIIAAHSMYSLILIGIAGPILRIHVGLVSRNETGFEWKKNINYVVKETKSRGNNVPVNDLSEEEFNEQFDYFVYDPAKNPFDKGTTKNCLAFWCTSRGSNNLGVF